MAKSSINEFLLEDVYLLCQGGSASLIEWLKENKIIGDFDGEECDKCINGTFYSVRDTSYSKDGFVWRCKNRKCNNKISIRRGSWFEQSHLTLQQVFKVTYMWVYKCQQQFVMRECRLSSFATIVDWYNFCREVCYNTEKR